MGRRAEWQEVLDAETERWSSMSCEHLIAELHDVQAYVVEVDSKQYQVEVQLLENTNAYVHVLVAVDDGSLPWSIVPLTRSFIRQKSAAGVEGCGTKL
jgi:hypothetical protein